MVRLKPNTNTFKGNVEIMLGGKSESSLTASNDTGGQQEKEIAEGGA